MRLKYYISYVIRKFKERNKKRYTVVKANIVLSYPNEVLNGRNILITGGSRGLGYCIAKKCIDEGANVLITGRNVDSLENAAAKLGERCKYAQLDMSEVSNFFGFFKKAEQIMECEKIDSVVGNAGVTIMENSFLDVSEESWIKQMNINLKGNYFFVQEYVKYLQNKSETKGNIIIVASERGLRPGEIPYDISKNGIKNYVRGIAPKLVSKNIRINAVAPGACASDLTKYDDNTNLCFWGQINQRLYRPEEVAEVISFLLQDISSCISGETIACDNGNYIATW